jgi:hypothetical protein
MVNRSDRHFPNPLGFRAVKGRWSDREKMCGFPSWPGAAAPFRGRIHERNRISPSQQQAALRTGLGPYMNPFGGPLNASELDRIVGHLYFRFSY